MQVGTENAPACVQVVWCPTIFVATAAATASARMRALIEMTIFDMPPIFDRLPLDP